MEMAGSPGRLGVGICRRVALARGSRESGQALIGAAISGVLLCGGLSAAVVVFPANFAFPGRVGPDHFPCPQWGDPKKVLHGH